jgi:hypothetical protein
MDPVVLPAAFVRLNSICKLCNLRIQKSLCQPKLRKAEAIRFLRLKPINLESIYQV